ncbi:hypothetical protein G9A89_010237 [Geosiphon pyriformis]|nr:hypothetical protein G9A89_010237 [Geosiphon pyriformis]
MRTPGIEPRSTAWQANKISNDKTTPHSIFNLGDIRSCINFKRSGLKTLGTNKLRDGSIYLFLHSVKLVVLLDDATSDEHELSQNILAISLYLPHAGKESCMPSTRAPEEMKSDSSSSQTRKMEDTFNRTPSSKAALEAVDEIDEA